MRLPRLLLLPVVGGAALFGVSAGAGGAPVMAQAGGGACTLMAPADVSTNDRFGSSIGIDGEVMAVGAWLADPDAVVDAGAVYIYQRPFADDQADVEAGTWVERQKLVAGTPQVGAGFGFAVDLQGDILAVGAYDEEIEVAGQIMTGAGAVYVFERQADGLWLEQARLTADRPASDDLFGHNLEVDRATETIVVGAPGSDPTTEAGQTEDAGSAYVFVKGPDGAWNRQAVLVDPNAQPGDRAGNDVAISGDRVVVGHHLDDRAADRNLSNAGGALVYSRFGADWGGPVELDGSEAARRDRAGIAVDIDGNVLVMSGWAQQPGDRAVAWVFERSAGDADAGDPASAWVERARIEPDQASVDGSHFGRHVELAGSVLAVGASLDDGVTVDGGTVFYYGRVGGEWVANGQMSPAPLPPGAQAGIALGLSDRWAAIGAERVALGPTNSGGACVVALAEALTVTALDPPAQPVPVAAPEALPVEASPDTGRPGGSGLPRRLRSARTVAVAAVGAVALLTVAGAGLLMARRRRAHRI